MTIVHDIARKVDSNREQAKRDGKTPIYLDALDLADALAENASGATVLAMLDKPHTVVNSSDCKKLKERFEKRGNSDAAETAGELFGCLNTRGSVIVPGKVRRMKVTSNGTVGGVKALESKEKESVFAAYLDNGEVFLTPNKARAHAMLSDAGYNPTDDDDDGEG